jgi:iron complex transport system ATP-binding protein
VADPAGSAVLNLRGVEVRRGGRTILGPLDWEVWPGDRWAVIGPNGSGKTTLAHVASTYLWPSRGRVEVLGEAIGSIDARELRRRVGYAGSALEGEIDPALCAFDVVVTARHAALAPWWHAFTDEDRARAAAQLDAVGAGGLADRPFGVLSTGERRRVLIARAMMPGPELLILDEPAASLDFGARELLVRDLGALAGMQAPAAIALVTHHVEEIPRGFERALVLSRGCVVAAGPIGDVLTSTNLTATFEMPIAVETVAGRIRAYLDEAL